jgi:hypothetical protein
MRSVFYLLILALLLASCSTAPSENAVQTAIAQTQIAQPTETPTPLPPTPTTIPTATVIPLKDINLSYVMFLPGDLPSGYEPSQIKSGVPGEGVINIFVQEIAYKGERGGRVSVSIYDTPEQASSAYQQVISNQKNDSTGFKQEAISDLGEKAFGLQVYVPLIGGLSPIQGSFITFVRCNALVEAGLILAKNYSGLVDYAQRLDERISKLVCR